MTAPKTILAPGEEPITVDDARAHLEAARYGDTELDATDDAMIESWIQSAREHCEDYLGLSLAVRTLEIALDEFPDDGAAIVLPNHPASRPLLAAWPAPRTILESRWRALR